MSILMRFPKGVQKALTLSYDDGVEQDVKLIDILDKYGLKCTFNLNSGCFAPESTVYPKGQVHRRMSRQMCEKVYINHEVAVHTSTHPNLNILSPERCTYEILSDRIELEKLTGKIVRGMAYPYGAYNDAVADKLKACGIVYSRTTKSTLNFLLPEDWLSLPATCHHNNPELMKLAKDFVDFCNPRQDAKMFYLWGHSYEFESDDNWNVIEEFAEFVSNKEDIWYATNIEIYDYIQAYKSLLFDINETVCKNPSGYELWFVLNGKTYCVKPGETISL